MKRLTLLLALALGAFVAASAQKTELRLSYGGYTQMDACDNHDDWGNVKTAWGAVNAGVNFKVMPKLWIGPSYTFSSTTTKGGPAHSAIAYHAVLLNARYEYFHNSLVTLYAHGAVGAVISHMQPKGFDAYNCAYFAGQISPVGAEVELNKSVAMFGELGFGAQGLLQVGFKVNI